MIRYCVHPDFASDKPGGRLRLQKQLDRALTRWKATYHSVTHTRGLGAIAVSDAPVGIDLEMRHRPVSKKVYLRIATDDETRMQIDPLQLWVMKEAAWKSLRGLEQPKVVSSIIIRHVTKMRTANGFRFLFAVKHSTMRGRGLLLVRGRYILGIAAIRP